MNYILLAVSVFIGSSKSLLAKQLKTKEKNYAQLFFDNTIAFFVALVIVGILSLFVKQDLFCNIPLFLAVCYAICTLLSQICLLLAMGSGSVSISQLFYSCGFIIPTFFGVIFYNEKINLLHLFAIALIVVSCCLGVNREKGVKFNFKWLIFAISGLIFSGVVGVIQKVFKIEYQNSSLNGFLLVSFLIIVLISMAISALTAYKQNKIEDLKPKEKSQNNDNILLFRVLLACVLGVSVATVNVLNTHLSGVLPSAVFFPCINGGVICITAIGSVVIFKEKLIAKKIASIVLCVTAIILIGIANTL